MKTVPHGHQLPPGHFSGNREETAGLRHKGRKKWQEKFKRQNDHINRGRRDKGREVRLKEQSVVVQIRQKSTPNHCPATFNCFLKAEKVLSLKQIPVLMPYKCSEIDLAV